MEHGSYLLMSLGLVALIAALVYLRAFVTIVPSLFACCLRWKEVINLEDSASLARMRNIVFSMIMLPFVLMATGYNIFCLEFLDNMGPELRFAICLGITAVYFGLRMTIAAIMRPSTFNHKLWGAYMSCFRDFFTLNTLECLAITGILALCNCSDNAIRSTILIISTVNYAIHLLRRMQIFASARGVFSSILYLCALEFLPSGILIAAAILF